MLLRRPAGARRARPDGTVCGGGEVLQQHGNRGAFAAACLGMLLFGIVLTSLGSILPSITERFSLARTAAGSLLALMPLSVLGASLVFGPLADRYGYRYLLAGAALLVLVGLEAIAFAPAAALLAPAIILTGLGGGLLNGGTSALVADLRPGDRGAGLSLLGACFGVGALGLPLLLSLLLEAVGYGVVVAGVGGFAGVVLALLLAVRFPAPKQPHGFPLTAALRLVRDPVLLLIGLTLLFQSGMENAAGGWTAAYVIEVLGTRPDRALVFLSLYWLGMTVARLATATVLRELPRHRFFMTSRVLSVAGIGLLLAGHGSATAVAAVLLLGAGFGAVFPVVLGLAGDRYPHLSGTAFSLVLVMALSGGTMFQLGIGVLADAWGLRVALGIAVPLALLCGTTTYLLLRPRLDRANPR